MGAKRVFGIETEYWITIDGVDARGAARGRGAGHATPYLRILRRFVPE